MLGSAGVTVISILAERRIGRFELNRITQYPASSICISTDRC